MAKKKVLGRVCKAAFGASLVAAVSSLGQLGVTATAATGVEALPSFVLSSSPASRAEFEAWCEDNHQAVTHHYVNGEWLAVIGSRSKPAPAQNLKAISQHRQKYRVSKRIDGKLFRWSFNTLKEAVAKRDAIFA